MDGKGYERDDIGDAQSDYRYGHEPSPDEDAHGDGGRSNNVGSGSPPPGYRRAAGTFGSPGWDSAAWDSPAADSPAWGSPGPESTGGGQTRERGHSDFPPPAPYQSPHDQPPFGETSPDGESSSYAESLYRDSSFGHSPYGQPGYGSPSPGPPPYETPSYGQAPYGGPEYGQSDYGRAETSRHERDTGSFDRTGDFDRPTDFDRSSDFDRQDHDRGRDIGWSHGEDTGGFRSNSLDRRIGMSGVHTAGHAALVEDQAAPGRGELEPSPLRRLARRTEVADDEDEERTGRRGRGGQGRRSMPLWQELPLLLVVAFCLAVLIRTFLLQAFYIPSGSMEQTLLVGDRVLVNKIVYDVRQPERGEVIVFRGTDSWVPENPPEPGGGLVARVGRTVGDLVGVSRPGEKDFIKRVIGVPGDRVSCCDPDGRVYVNGQGIDEPYVLNNSPVEVPPDPNACRSRRFDEVLVPPGQLFVMGDHRIVSQDSRCQGTVPIENVIGRAFVLVWPSGRWDTLSVPETFANVPGPVALGGTGAQTRLSAPPGAGAAAISVPILASLVAMTRSGRKPRLGRSTLPK